MPKNKNKSYFSLTRVIPEHVDENGIGTCKGIVCSIHEDAKTTILHLVNRSRCGCTELELREYLKIVAKWALLELYNAGRVSRAKFWRNYVYFLKRTPGHTIIRSTEAQIGEEGCRAVMYAIVAWILEVLEIEERIVALDATHAWYNPRRSGSKDAPTNGGMVEYLACFDRFSLASSFYWICLHIPAQLINPIERGGAPPTVYLKALPQEYAHLTVV